jgi:4,5:9,10-diseco-3-hydroxy-5,9,17-trioxoandrosta-1(10),2-diene-4-oate hydrolase
VDEILIDGVRLAIAREGSGPPVLCLHAIGHGARDYETFSALTRRRYEIIRLDWPGQGRSDPDQEPATSTRYAALIRGVVDALRLEPPIIIGCSIGGAAAIRYASENPVVGLVLANSGGLIEVTKSTQRVCLLFSRTFAAGSRGAWWYKAAFAQFYRSVLPSPAALDQRKRIAKSAHEIAPVLAEAWRGFADAAQDHRGLAIALDVPVLFAWAMQDWINPFTAGRTHDSPDEARPSGKIPRRPRCVSGATGAIRRDLRSVCDGNPRGARHSPAPQDRSSQRRRLVAGDDLGRDLGRFNRRLRFVDLLYFRIGGLDRRCEFQNSLRE